MDAALRRGKRAAHIAADFSGWHRRFRPRRMAHVERIAAEVGFDRLAWQPGDKAIAPALEQASSDFCRGFLRGFFDADGSVQGDQRKGVSVRLAQSDLSAPASCRSACFCALESQASSTASDVRPSPRCCQMAKVARRHYQVKAQHELVVAGANLERFRDFVGFADTDKVGKARSSTEALPARPQSRAFHRRCRERHTRWKRGRL